MQGKLYSWKDTQRFGAQTEMGFIAQEVEPYVPEVVRTVGTFKTLNYANLVALHNEGLKELDIRLSTIEALSGIDETSTLQSLFGRFAEFLRSTTTKIIGGVVRFTDRTIHKELCIGEGEDITCITKSQLDSLLENNNIEPSPVGTSTEDLSQETENQEVVVPDDTDTELSQDGSLETEEEQSLDQDIEEQELSEEPTDENNNDNQDDTARSNEVILSEEDGEESLKTEDDDLDLESEGA